MAIQVQQALLSLGSSIEPERHVPRALSWLEGRLHVRVISPCYRTAAVGGRPEDPDFVNLAVRIATDLPPRALREVCRRVEDVCGRRRTDDRNAPRTLDVDLVLYDALSRSYGSWVLPDPQLTTQPFVLVPAADVWPDALVPGREDTLATLVAALPEEIRAELIRIEEPPFVGLSSRGGSAT